MRCWGCIGFVGKWLGGREGGRGLAFLLLLLLDCMGGERDCAASEVGGGGFLSKVDGVSCNLHYRTY